MTKWSSLSKELSLKLHSCLTITERDWHKLSSNKKRRAAELLSGALVQLLSDGKISDVIELAEQSNRWLKDEVHATNCSNKK